MTFRPMAALAERQHRLPEAGRIRLGRKVPTKSGKMRPDKLTTLRFTSPNRDTIDQLAKLYGGTVQPWEGDWEVVTDSPEVPIVLPTDDPLGNTPIYELWNRGGLERRCDGETVTCPKRVSDDEVEMAVEPCLCNARKLAECKVTVRLSVILPDVAFAGTWRCETHSWNAADELPGMVEAIRSFSQRGFVRAYLGIRVEEKMEAGKKKQWIVPYLRLDESVNGALAGGGGLAAIPAGPILEIGSGTPEQVPAGLHPSGASGLSSGARPPGDGSSAGLADLVPAVEAKRALLAACDGDRTEAVRLWGGRGSSPVSRTDLDGLLAECEPVDAEIVEDGRPF